MRHPEALKWMPRVQARTGIANGLLSDRFDRSLQDLRISVTDRCNFRCTYCMPKQVFGKDYRYLPHTSLLSQVGRRMEMSYIGG